ncbi:MAG: dihydrofolate reductase family protein [Acidobacteriota bacterium]
MRKLIAAMNMTLNGVCDHTAMIAGDEIHQHYTLLLRDANTIIYGRKTFELMEYWKTVLENPTGIPAMDDFADAIDQIGKIVYSRTVDKVDWQNTELKREIVPDEISALKDQDGKSILVGSPSMIIALMNLGLIDEIQLSIHPTVVGHGLQLFTDVSDRVDLKLFKTKTFGCGAVTHVYQVTAAGLG